MSERRAHLLLLFFFFFSPFFLYLVVWFFPLLNISPPDCISPTIYIYIYIAHYYVAFSLGFFCSFFFKRWFKKLNPDRSFLFYHSDMSLGYWMDKIYIFFFISIFLLTLIPETMTFPQQEEKVCRVKQRYRIGKLHFYCYVHSLHLGVADYDFPL